MDRSIKYLLLFLLLTAFKIQSQIVVIKGKITDIETGQVLQNAVVKLSNTVVHTSTDKNGDFVLAMLKRPFYRLFIQHLSYEPLTINVRDEGNDTIILKLTLKQKPTALDSVEVFAISKPETLVGKPQFSIYDFDFYEDKFILLTAENSLKKAQVRLADYQGQLYDSWAIPNAAGLAKGFFHDYEGYPDLICNDSVFRIEVVHTQLFLSCIRKEVFERSIKPVADTLNANIFFSDHWDKYPVMNYYTIKNEDTLAKLLKNISNADLLKLYNLEYYYLPSRGQLEARRLAAELKSDKHVIAAMMSGFTSSMYYEPLYAPLFVIKDTICIFNHHNDFLYHYNSDCHLIDSVKIAYHHPKNWHDWKKQLFFDEAQQTVYAFFSKDGHHYLKEINFQNGKIVSEYKLKHHSAEKIKVRDGYVYYVYRPFESTQQKFLYRERIGR